MFVSYDPFLYFRIGKLYLVVEVPPDGRGRFTNLVAELALAPRYRSVTFYLVAEVKLEPGCRSATCYLVAEVPPVTW